jgi:malate dehydrogenase (oxaloacetate-decarboxylating)
MTRNVVKLSLPPEEMLNLPLINKGTAFTQKERDAFGLNGFLPTHVATIEEQILRTYENFHKQSSPLEKYVFLMGVMNRNELLFYQFVSKYPAEMLPIIYTPTVGDAAVHYSQIYFRQRGLYLSYPLMDKIDEIFSHYPRKDIQVIVATDGERILGLGDQGIGGMTIPVGKLNLYTLFGGIHPEKTLPILLDVGTNNLDLLNNKLYLGWRHHRLQGQEYDQFIDQFVRSVKKWFPKALLQWEDFGRSNARRILDTYRSKILSFNDDIQGTSSVTLGALLAAVRGAKQKLVDQKIAILGGGSAGTGIADGLVMAMEHEGLSLKQALDRIFIVDQEGLITYKTSQVFDAQKPYVKSKSAIDSWDLLHPNSISMMDVIKNVAPTVLIGVSGQGGAFTKAMIQEMSRLVERPIIFPLSNPTSKAEATPRDIIEWTQGKVVIATGSPFSPVSFGGKTYTIAQCNNVYVFPGVGAGAVAADATEISDTMLLEASKILASFSPALKNLSASLLPDISDVRKVCRAIAIGVARQAIHEGFSKVPLSDVEKHVDAIMWEPSYPIYVPE